MSREINYPSEIIKQQALKWQLRMYSIRARLHGQSDLGCYTFEIFQGDVSVSYSEFVSHGRSPPFKEKNVVYI